MAARFWVGGTGNWSNTARWSATSGGAGGASVPGTGDTATFNASSGAGIATVDSNVTIQTLTLTGYTGTLAFGTNSISLNSTGTVFTGATTCTITGTPVINVTSAGSTAITVASGAMTEANSISFNFTGGTYALTFLGPNETAKNVNFTGFAGTWATLNNGIVYGNFTLSTGMTFSSAGAGINFLATSGTQTVTSNGKSFGTSVVASGDIVSNTAGTRLFADALSCGQFTWGYGTTNINDKTITCTSVVGNSTVFAKTIAFGTGNIVCTGSGTAINIAPTNVTITGTPVINVSNNSATATTVTIGAFSEANSISFNFTTGTYTLTNTAGNVYKNLNFTGFAGTLGTLGTGTSTIYGDLTFSTGMTLPSTASIWTFASTSATSRVITCNGKTVDRPLTFNGAGGAWQLADALTQGSTRNFTHTNGTIDLNGKTLTVGTAYTTATGTKNLTFNGGTLVCPTASTTAFNNAQPTNYTTTAGTGTGKISMTAATAKTFVGGGSTFNCTLSNDGAGALTVTGANTFTTIANGVQPTSFLFTAATTTTVTNWSVSGTAGNLVTIGSVTAATHTLSKASGTVNSDYLSISFSIATGGATWYAGNNSTNGGNNTGWIFSAAPSAFGNFFFMF